MAFSFKNDWAFGSIRKTVDDLTEKQIRTLAFAAEKNGFKGHSLATNSKNKTVSLISAKKTGPLLPYAVKEQLASLVDEIDLDNFIFLEQKQSDIYLCGFLDGDICADFLTDVHHYEFDLGLSLIKSIINKNDIKIVVSKTVDVDWLAGEVGLLVDEVRGVTVPIPELIEQLEPSEGVFRLHDASEIKLDSIGKSKPMILAASVGFLLVLSFFFMGEEEEIKPVVQKDPYEKYVDILTNTGISPKTRLSYLYNDTTAFKELSGWEVKTIDLQEKSSVVTLENDGGTFDELEQFGYKRQYSITKVNQNYVATSVISHTPLLNEPVFVPGDSTLRFVEVATRTWLPEHAIDKVSAPVSNGKWSEIKFNLKIGNDGWTKHDFDTLGTILSGLPVGFINGRLIYEKDKNRYTGDIGFVIYGSV